MQKRMINQLATVSIFVCLALLLSTITHADRIKVSYKGEDLPSCPSNQGAVVKVGAYDATRAQVGDTIRRVTGDSGFTKDDGVDSNGMYLECPVGGQQVDLDHEAIEFLTDDDGFGGEVIKFSAVNITSYDQDQIDLIVPTIETQSVWCSLFIPETGSGCVWEFPNGMRLDRVPPNINGNILVTEAQMGLEDGQVYWNWSYNDSAGLTPSWPNGGTGTMCGPCGVAPIAGGTAGGKWCCNATDERAQWQLFRRPYSGLYTTDYESTTDGSLYEIIDTGPTTSNDRFVSNPSTFCYVIRVQDTAGNWSITTDNLNVGGTSTKDKEKCIRPDGKDPEVESVEFFTDYDPVTGFANQFPYDYAGDPIISTNPCHFDPSCDTSVDRYIEIKITMNEPLFDGVNRYGYTYVAGDGFDNDNDGLIDDLDEPGGFDGCDNDGDGLIDEDVGETATTYPDGTLMCGGPDTYGLNDRADNDADGYVDEVSDSDPGDATSRHCESKQLFNRAHTTALDEDTCFDEPLIYISGDDPSGNAIAKQIEWICTQDGVTTHPDCTSLSIGKTIYKYQWRVGRADPGDSPPVGLEEGEFDITISAMDGVGNAVTQITPLEGSPVKVDNTPPDVEINIYSNAAFSNPFIFSDHDNDPVTPNMFIIPETTMYFSVSLKEGLGQYRQPSYAGATPEVYIFLPDDRIPPYEGEATASVAFMRTLTVYPKCGQNADCDYITGDNCMGYGFATEPCSIFRGAFTIDSATMNNGYAAFTVNAKDAYSNRKWHSSDAQANADQFDADGLSDDTGEDGTPATFDDYESDGIPTFISLDPSEIEPDITIDLNQFFAIDTTPPETPALGRPIAPCNGGVARDNMSCSSSMGTVDNPTLRWTTLNNTLNDDGDATTDEECIDGADDDGDDEGDGTDRGIDEDGKVCNNTGTQSWEIAYWRLQVATMPDFATDSMIRNTFVSTVNAQMQVLDERPISSPYYWRVAPFDTAGNMGEYNPQSPMVATATPYFTFAVDTTPPQFSIEYFINSTCSVAIPTAPDGTPVIGDTADNPEEILCMEISSDEPIPWATEPTAIPTITIYQQGFAIPSADEVAATPVPATSATTFQLSVEIDAKGFGQEFVDGPAEVKISAEDVYGNDVVEGDVATGSQFYVDSADAECEFDAPFPDPASADNNSNGDEGDPEPYPEGDAVTITFTCNKYIGDPVSLRVLQNKFTSHGADDDLLDNDCDGRIDEELSNGVDDDGDGAVDEEDTGTSGEVSGTGCWISADYQDDTSYTYTGYYDVVPANFDGEAQVVLGDTDVDSMYFLTDLIGNTIYASTTFEVDTMGPARPLLKSPINEKILDTTLPQFKWSINPRASDLNHSLILVATSSSNFNNEIYAASATYSDSGSNTDFAYYFIESNISECQVYIPIGDCPGMSDNIYYWRVYAVDDANNLSEPSLTYTFSVDTQPPGPPVFNDVTNPTTLGYAPLSGYTNPPEKGAFVNIYTEDALGRQTYAGTVMTEDSGTFTVGINDDGDLETDEDEVDDLDNDSDGQTDEDPPGVFLNEGANSILGLVIDAGGQHRDTWL